MKKKIMLILLLIALLLMTACSVDVGGDRVNFTGWYKGHRDKGSGKCYNK